MIYHSCIMDDGSDDTFEYGGGNNQSGVPVMIPVPLTEEGTNYYYSGADNAVQCQQGMAFQIVVNYGLGLPPSLVLPALAPYVDPPTASDVPSSGGGLRTNANLRWVVWDMLFGACLFLLLL